MSPDALLHLECKVDVSDELGGNLERSSDERAQISSGVTGPEEVA